MRRKCSGGISFEGSPLISRLSLENKKVVFFSGQWRDKELAPGVKVQSSVAFTCEWIVISLVWISWVGFNNLQKASAGSISLLWPAELHTYCRPSTGHSASAQLEGAFLWPGLFAFSLSLSLLYIILPLGLVWLLQVEKEPTFFFVRICSFSQKWRWSESAVAVCRLPSQWLFPFFNFQLASVSWWPGWRAGSHSLNIPSGTQTQSVCAHVCVCVCVSYLLPHHEVVISSRIFPLFKKFKHLKMFSRPVILTVLSLRMENIIYIWKKRIFLRSYAVSDPESSAWGFRVLSVHPGWSFFIPDSCADRMEGADGESAFVTGSP